MDNNNYTVTDLTVFTPPPDPYTLNQKIISIENKLKKWVVVENDSFRIKLNDGSWQTLDFEPRSGSSNMFKLFELLFSNWQKYGEKRPISKKEIESNLHISNEVIESSKSNINKKIRIKKLENIVLINYDFKAHGYYLSLKKPTQ